METISTTETLRDEINGMKVQGTVYRDRQNPERDRIENGRVDAENGQWLASWSMAGDKAVNINYSGETTDRAAVLAVIEGFIGECMSL